MPENPCHHTEPMETFILGKIRKLNELVTNANLDVVKIRELRDAYKRLVWSREENDQVGITNANHEIETIKSELSRTGIEIDQLQEIYERCENISRLKVEWEIYRERRYQIQQNQ